MQGGGVLRVTGAAHRETVGLSAIDTADLGLRFGAACNTTVQEQKPPAPSVILYIGFAIQDGCQPAHTLFSTLPCMEAPRRAFLCSARTKPCAKPPHHWSGSKNGQSVNSPLGFCTVAVTVCLRQSRPRKNKIETCCANTHTHTKLSPPPPPPL